MLQIGNKKVEAQHFFMETQKWGECFQIFVSLKKLDSSNDGYFINIFNLTFCDSFFRDKFDIRKLAISNSNQEVRVYWIFLSIYRKIKESFLR